MCKDYTQVLFTDSKSQSTLGLCALRLAHQTYQNLMAAMLKTLFCDLHSQYIMSMTYITCGSINWSSSTASCSCFTSGKRCISTIPFSVTYTHIILSVFSCCHTLYIYFYTVLSISLAALVKK